jgi:RimJ/RimL family protein N-acetyltransferase
MTNLLAAEIFAAKPTLYGERATLRPFQPQDITAMAGILQDPEVLRLTGSAHSTAETEAGPVDISGAGDGAGQLDAETRRWYETRAEQKDRLDLAVIAADSGACVGEVVLNEWSPDNDDCSFRILLGPAGRDRGIGSEATRLIVDYAFRSTGINRIGLEVYAFNPRARHVYERAGFVSEGTRRAALKFDGGYVDAEVMSILRSDWLDEEDPAR